MRVAGMSDLTGLRHSERLSGTGAGSDGALEKVGRIRYESNATHRDVGDYRRTRLVGPGCRTPR